MALMSTRLLFIGMTLLAAVRSRVMAFLKG